MPNIDTFFFSFLANGKTVRSHIVALLSRAVNIWRHRKLRFFPLTIQSILFRDEKKEGFIWCRKRIITSQELRKYIYIKRRQQQINNWHKTFSLLLFYLHSVYNKFIRKRNGKTSTAWQFVNDNGIFSFHLLWFYHFFPPVKQSLFWISTSVKLQCALRIWQRSYLWFFMESDVHPPVARQSSLVHCMMPEVIIICKNLNTGEEMSNYRGSIFRCRC